MIVPIEKEERRKGEEERKKGRDRDIITFITYKAWHGCNKTKWLKHQQPGYFYKKPKPENLTLCFPVLNSSK